MKYPKKITLKITQEAWDEINRLTVYIKKINKKATKSDMVRIVLDHGLDYYAGGLEKHGKL